MAMQIWVMPVLTSSSCPWSSWRALIWLLMQVKACAGEAAFLLALISQEPATLWNLDWRGEDISWNSLVSVSAGGEERSCLSQWGQVTWLQAAGTVRGWLGAGIEKPAAFSTPPSTKPLLTESSQQPEAAQLHSQLSPLLPSAELILCKTVKS